MICEYGCGREANYQLSSGKWCCSEKFQSCPEQRRKNSEHRKNLKYIEERNTKLGEKKCQFCGRICKITNVTLHERKCYLNPKNTKKCAVCEKPLKHFRTTTVCSTKCARQYFKDSYKDSHYIRPDEDCVYRTLCFRYHKHKCLICGEEIAVSVHHVDGNHNNHTPENLVPLCRNHHHYYHSNYRYLVEDQINQYVKDFVEKQKECGMWL